MPPPPAEPSGLVLLASEQLWPNLHSLAHWAPGLRHVRIYRTTDVDRSGTPARRLEALARRICPAAAVRLSEPGGITPDAVRTEVAAWLGESPGESWLINATGGLKPMFAGALAFVGRARVVYRELGGDRWYELRGRPDDLRTEALAVPADATDRVDVTDLVRAAWGDEAAALRAPDPLDVLRLTRAVVGCSGDWRAAFRAAGVPAEQSSGFLFEDYVAAAVLALGVRNIVANSRRRGAGGTDLHEIDLIANSNGRLSFVDSKLRSDRDEAAGHVEGIASQIRQAQVTREKVGGLGGRLLLVRPNWPLNEDLRAFAHASRLDVLDASDARRLFSRLAAFFGVSPLPDPLREAEALLAAAGGSVFGSPRHLAALGDAARDDLIDLDLALEGLRRERGQDWAAHQFRGQAVIVWDVPDGLGKTDAQRRLCEALIALTAAPRVELSNSGKRAWAYLELQAEARSRLLGWLRRRRGRPLLS